MEYLKIGDVLKRERNNSGISVKEISDILTNKGYRAGENTIYSWENNNSQPTPDILLLLCGLYGITDVLSTFGYTETKKAVPSGEAKSGKYKKIIEALDEFTPEQRGEVIGYINRIREGNKAAEAAKERSSAS